MKEDEMGSAFGTYGREEKRRASRGGKGREEKRREEKRREEKTGAGRR
jgi:hypothetical protein